MSSPPPPRESHPPLPEDGFYEADPDVDTGPVHIVTPADEGYYPPPAEDTFAGRFHGAPDG